MWGRNVTPHSGWIQGSLEYSSDYPDTTRDFPSNCSLQILYSRISFVCRDSISAPHTASLVTSFQTRHMTFSSWTTYSSSPKKISRPLDFALPSLSAGLIYHSCHDGAPPWSEDHARRQSPSMKLYHFHDHLPWKLRSRQPSSRSGRCWHQPLFWLGLLRCSRWPSPQLMLSCYCSVWLKLLTGFPRHLSGLSCRTVKHLWSVRRHLASVGYVSARWYIWG